jgi:endo-1,4-beta-xylanase
MYKAMLEATLESEGATTFMLWGFTDKHSWIPGTFPGTGDALIFDKIIKRNRPTTHLLQFLKEHKVRL